MKDNGKTKLIKGNKKPEQNQTTKPQEIVKGIQNNESTRRNVSSRKQKQ